MSFHRRALFVFNPLPVLFICIISCLLTQTLFQLRNHLRAQFKILCNSEVKCTAILKQCKLKRQLTKVTIPTSRPHIFMDDTIQINFLTYLPRFKSTYLPPVISHTLMNPYFSNTMHVVQSLIILFFLKSYNCHLFI